MILKWDTIQPSPQTQGGPKAPLGFTSSAEPGAPVLIGKSS